MGSCSGKICPSDDKAGNQARRSRRSARLTVTPSKKEDHVNIDVEKVGALDEKEVKKEKSIKEKPKRATTLKKEAEKEDEGESKSKAKSREKEKGKPSCSGKICPSDDKAGNQARRSRRSARLTVTPSKKE